MAPRSVLLDLPDNCLVLICQHLAPLPDKFNVSAACWRFHQLLADRRHWLVVSPTPLPPGTAPGGAGPVYPHLRAAVAASRPGDTIWLAPGVPHVAVDVAIPWPLALIGGGAHPHDTRLLTSPPTPRQQQQQHKPPAAAAAGATTGGSSAPLPDCALRVSASAKVANLSIATSRCPGIIHTRGSLTLQRCLLSAEPCGLPHLVSPLLTLAMGGHSGSGGGGGGGSNTAGDAGTVAAAAATMPAVAAAAAAAVAAPPPGTLACAAGAGLRLPLVGEGRLLVVECQLLGGATAVLCGGSGRVRNVRAIYESCSAAPVFWLEVDSAGDAAAGPQGCAPLPPPTPAMLAAAPCVPAAACGADDAPEEDVLLQQRSKLWQAQHQQQHSVGARCPAAGLARISAVLGRHGISPATLAGHLAHRAPAPPL